MNHYLCDNKKETHTDTGMDSNVMFKALDHINVSSSTSHKDAVLPLYGTSTHEHVHHANSASA